MAKISRIMVWVFSNFQLEQEINSYFVSPIAISAGSKVQLKLHLQAMVNYECGKGLCVNKTVGVG